MTESETSQAEALAESVAAICADHGNRPDALIEILRDVQLDHGCVPDGALQPIADALNISRADVYGVVSFYHDFTAVPDGRHVLKVCRAESCQANGSEALAAHAEQALGVAFGVTTADGEFTLKPVYCLGNCALGPSVLVGETLHARVDGAKFDRIVAGLKEAKA